MELDKQLTEKELEIAVKWDELQTKESEKDSMKWKEDLFKLRDESEKYYKELNEDIFKLSDESGIKKIEWDETIRSQTKSPAEAKDILQTMLDKYEKYYKELNDFFKLSDESVRQIKTLKELPVSLEEIKLKWDEIITSRSKSKGIRKIEWDETIRSRTKSPVYLGKHPKELNEDILKLSDESEKYPKKLKEDVLILKDEPGEYFYGTKDRLIKTLKEHLAEARDELKTKQAEYEKELNYCKEENEKLKREATKNWYFTKMALPSITKLRSNLKKELFETENQQTVMYENVVSMARNSTYISTDIKESLQREVMLTMLLRVVKNRYEQDSILSAKDQSIRVKKLHEKSIADEFINDLHLKREGDKEIELKETPCTRHHKHEHFFDVEQFELKFLPPIYQKPVMQDLIKSLSDLTVMIEVKDVCETRKDNISDMKPSDIMAGSGKVEEVFLYKNSPCKCYDCKDSASSKCEWGEIEIVTSAKVVTRKKEVQNVQCILFYDKSKQSNITEIIKGDRIVSLNKDRNICKFLCVTHNIDLLQKLDRMVDVFVENWKKCYTIFKSVKSSEDRLVVIVSHPHGCKKHISVGKWMKQYNEDQVLTGYKYDTPTCPGCSGAYVLIPNFDDAEDINLPY